MLPSSYPYDRKKLKAAWTAYAETGNLAVAYHLDPAVRRSWYACSEAGLDPRGTPPLTYSGDEVLDQRRQASFDFIAVARPFIEDVYQFSGESDLVLFLADDALCAVDWLGDSDLFERLAEKGLRPGAHLLEEEIGTNAAALALSEGVPVQVVGAEHFHQTFHDITGTAAPVHATTGRTRGVIGLVTPEEYSHPHTLGIVMAAAKAIENQLQADQSLSDAHQHLGELKASLQAVGQGMVFLDAAGTVTHINASAGDVLGISHRKAMGRRFDSLVDPPGELHTAMTEGKAMEEREVVFHVGAEPRPCLMRVDLLEQSSQPPGFVLTLERTTEAKRLVHRMVGAKSHFTFDDILGQCVSMRRVLYYARTIAECDSPVLLLGESGTGKELFAQAIHSASQYEEGPFVAFDCAAIPRELLSGELFGYAETSPPAAEGRPGRLELADGGTMFFDNVDNLPPNIQASLLRVIDKKEITRLGGDRIIHLDLRFIAASNNPDLAGEVKAGRFRPDLFYRLQAMTLTIPPLRERGDDIVLIIAHLTEELARRSGKAVRISPRAMALLQSYHWPGNIKELENVLEWAMHMADGAEITVEHLPQELRRAVVGADQDQQVFTLQEAERQAIIRAGQALDGQVTRMAEALGIGRTTLWRKMKAYNLSTDSFEPPVRAGEVEVEGSSV